MRDKEKERDSKKAYNKAYREANKERMKAYNKAYNEANKEANKEKKKAYNKAYNEANKEERRAKGKAYREANKEEHKAYREANKEKAKAYYEANIDKIKAYNKEYRANNKEKLNELAKVYTKKRRAIDPLFKMKDNIRTRTWFAFKKGGYKKNTKTAETLGAPFQEVFDHLENLFTEGMSWENQGEWHVDHIIPLASANTKEELIALCHYTNLQPLWAEDNFSKGDKLNWGKS
tara:strand:+ start:212 stop:910 length:699 start_codon:yes stop_codon:yes gene_type:complete